MKSKIRPAMCKNCSCLTLLGELIKYHKGEKLTKGQLMSVREAIEGQGEFLKENGEYDGFRCYMDGDDQVLCRGQKLAYNYINKNKIIWVK